jgi:hypothetical protein
MANLITLTELKTALAIDLTDTRKDSQYNQMIPWASAAVVNFAERDFGTPSVTEERTYAYDGSGYLDIDDASVVTAVKQVVPFGTDIILDVNSWTALPYLRDDSPVFYYIMLGHTYYLGSPEMGFTRNLDVYYRDRQGMSGNPSTMKVTGTWGWPVVPDDVKLATIWTITDWTAKGAAGEGLTSEAIEGYSRSWGNKQGGATTLLAIPNRARDLLARYAKINA